MFNLSAIKREDSLALELEPAPRVWAVTGSGDIRVRSHEGDKVQAALEITVKAPTEDRAVQVLAALRRDPPVERLGDTLSIGNLGKYAFSNASDVSVVIDIELLTPYATAFRLRSGSGNHDVRHVRGPLEASAGSGNIDIEQLEGALQAKTGSGNLTVRGAGRVEGRTGSGNIRLQDVGSSVEVRTGSGNITLAAIDGDVQAKSGSGDIEISSGTPLRESWRLKGSSGSIHATLAGESSLALEARTGSGRIEVDVPLSFVSVRRPQHVKGQTDDAPEGSLELFSSSGDIVVRPSRAGAGV